MILRGRPAGLVCIALLGTLLSSSAAQGAQIVAVPSKATPDELAQAKQALQGGSVVAMYNATPQSFSGDFNLAIPQTSQSRQHEVRFTVLAAYRTPNGVIQTYVGPPESSAQSGASAWETDFQDWAEQVDLPKDGATPDAAAWTPLSVSTLNATSDNGNSLREMVSVYRANSSNSRVDYYMVTKQVDTKPDYSGCQALASCHYLNTSRTMTIQTDVPAGPEYALFDHGPTTANGSTSEGFSIGAGVDGLTPTVSASYSETWNVQDVATQDNTDSNTNVASWTDNFSEAGATNGHPPAATTGLYEDDQAAIFTVPAGTATFNVLIQDRANFGGWTAWSDLSDWVAVDAFVLVQPPSLTVSPANLVVLPGQHVTFNITASIPASSGENLSWNISNIPGSLSLNTTTGAGSQSIVFDVPSNATPGLLGTLNIDTNPVYGAPEVRTGPIQLPITVVNSANSIAPGVLITGGKPWDSPEPLSTAEVWNPATQVSTPVGDMTTARMNHTANAVAGNQVFIAGGLDSTYLSLNTTELYNELTQQFTAGPPMKQARAYHTATLLNDGTVLLVGGYDQNGNVLASAEIYNPTNNTIAQTGSMSQARTFHTATLLADGRVLIAGGSSSASGVTPAPLATAEIYNPQTRTFSPTGSMPAPVQGQTATLLPNGQVLLARGLNSNGVSTAVMLFTPASGAFTSESSHMMDEGFPNAAMVTLAPAEAAAFNAAAVLIEGWGDNQNGALEWLTNNSFGASGAMQEIRDQPAALVLQNTNTAWDGCVMAAGGVESGTGSSGGTTIEVELYKWPQVAKWVAAGKMTTPRSGHTLTLFGIGNAASSASQP